MKVATEFPLQALKYALQKACFFQSWTKFYSK